MFPSLSPVGNLYLGDVLDGKCQDRIKDNIGEEGRRKFVRDLNRDFFPDESCLHVPEAEIGFVRLANEVLHDQLVMCLHLGFLQRRSAVMTLVTYHVALICKKFSEEPR